MMISVV